MSTRKIIRIPFYSSCFFVLSWITYSHQEEKVITDIGFSKTPKMLAEIVFSNEKRGWAKRKLPVPTIMLLEEWLGERDE